MRRWSSKGQGLFGERVAQVKHYLAKEFKHWLCKFCCEIKASWKLWLLGIVVRNGRLCKPPIPISPVTTLEQYEKTLEKTPWATMVQMGHCGTDRGQMARMWGNTNWLRPINLVQGGGHQTQTWREPFCAMRCGQSHNQLYTHICQANLLYKFMFWLLHTKMRKWRNTHLSLEKIQERAKGLPNIGACWKIPCVCVCMYYHIVMCGHSNGCSFSQLYICFGSSSNTDLLSSP